jgi:hypothetical protein
MKHQPTHVLPLWEIVTYINEYAEKKAEKGKGRIQLLYAENAPF